MLSFIGVTTLSLAVGFLAATFIKSPSQIVAEATPPPYTDLTAVVEVGQIEQRLLANGIVSLGNSIELSPALPDGVAPLVTALPVGVGSAVQPGTVLLETADRPAILLAGDIPLLRDLRRGDRGEDVSRLQQGLQVFGGPTPDGVFGQGTERALRSLYERAGYSPPLDGFSRPIALRSELLFAPNGGIGRVIAMGVTLGSVATAPAITLTTSPLVVMVDVAPSDAARLAPGAGADIIGVGGSGASRGTISSVGVPTATEQAGLQAAIVVALDEEWPPELVGAPVQLSFDTVGSPEEGLIVPLSSLNADPSGSTFVVVAEDESRKRVKVRVAETGAGAARVVAEGGTLDAGALVIVGSRWR